MDFKLAQNFINTNQESVLEIFSTYQMIEILLFMKLYPSDSLLTSSRDDEINKLNKELNSKTLRKMTIKYLEKYPQDDYGLKILLEKVTPQRNTFMHSLWIILSAAKNKEQATKHGSLILEDFKKNANNLLDILLKVKFD